MEKIFVSLLFAILLIAPLSVVEAKNGHDKDRYDKKHDHHDSQNSGSSKLIKFSRETKKKLESLNLDIRGINARVEALEQQGDSLPEDLALKLQALELAIGENTVDITSALEDIDRILAKIKNHESRLLLLEQGTPPPAEPEIIFTGTFTQGVVPAPSIGEDWLDFRSKATGPFRSIKISSSNGGSAICSDQLAASAIANELNSHVPTDGSLTTIDCQDKKWNVGQCNIISVDSAVELNASLGDGVCGCDQGATVRPGIGTISWGGVGSDFGGPAGPADASCFGGALTQTLEVILTR